MLEVAVLTEIQTMETFPFVSKTGQRTTAFEIENAYVSRRTIVRLLKQANGITDVHLGGRFGSPNDVRITFKYLDRDYIVWEPFGDNSRYWIGPKNSEESMADASELENIFERYKPPFYRALLGDLLTLRLFKRMIDRH